MDKTKGKFTVKSNYDKDFAYSGYSRQCEVMFKDYSAWCAKGKAPKKLQEHYDKVKSEAGDKKLEKPIFVLTVEKMTDEEFSSVAKKAPSRKAKAPTDFVPPKMKEIVQETGKVFSISTGKTTKK